MKNLWNKFQEWRMNMRESAVYRVIERALRVGIIGGVATALTLFLNSPEWTWALLKATLFAGLLSGLDKFKNELRAYRTSKKK